MFGPLQPLGGTSEADAYQKAGMQADLRSQRRVDKAVHTESQLRAPHCMALGCNVLLVG